MIVENNKSFSILDICDRKEISQTRRRANLLKKKVLSAGSIVGGKSEKDKGNLKLIRKIF